MFQVNTIYLDALMAAHRLWTEPNVVIRTKYLHFSRTENSAAQKFRGVLSLLGEA